MKYFFSVAIHVNALACTNRYCTECVAYLRLKEPQSMTLLVHCYSTTLADLHTIGECYVVYRNIHTYWLSGVSGPATWPLIWWDIFTNIFTVVIWMKQKLRVSATLQKISLKLCIFFNVSQLTNKWNYSGVQWWITCGVCTHEVRVI